PAGGGGFPSGAFRIDRAEGAVLEQAGGDELLLADGRSRGQPFVILITAPSTSVGLRISGQLVMPEPATAPGAPGDQHAADAATAQHFWRGLNGSLIMEAPASLDVADLHAILPWFVHDAWIHHLAPPPLEHSSPGRRAA